MRARRENFQIRTCAFTSAYIAAALFVVSQSSHAMTWNVIQKSMKDLSGQELRSDVAVELAVLPQSVLLESNEFGFRGDAERSSFHSNTGINALRDVLSEAGLHPLVSLAGLAVDADPDASTVDYSYNVNGTPVCRTTLRTVTNSSGETVVVGRVPMIDGISSYRLEDWPRQSFAAQSARESLSTVLSSSEGQEIDVKSIAVKNASRCLSANYGEIKPVWSFVLEYGLKRFEVEADEHEVTYMQQRYFDGVTGKIQAYHPNIVSGVLSEFQVPLDGSGSLRNSSFRTQVYGELKPQVSQDGVFLFSGKDVASAESSTFAYANLQADYFKALGTSWGEQEQISIYTNVEIRGDKNVASYIPSSGSDGPMIALGTGDGVLYDNLSFDADVVGHELGHHLIFRSIKETNFESMTLHEGLADFFALSRTGDTCVGESVCASGLSSCGVYEQKCLRSADNSLKYKDEAYASYVKGNDPHLTGQLMSGFLWDLRRSDKVPGEVLAQYVVQSLSYLPTDAQIKNFVAALLYTDSVRGGVYQSAILAAAEARGLGVETLGINLSDLQSTASQSGAELGGEEATRVGGSKSSKSGAFGCGTVVGSHYSWTVASWWVWALIMMIPLFVSVTQSVIARAGRRRVM